ncbi:ubx domain-containing protein [Diaporthe amygdali]|uniref:ubx domain-containing protein n=1 Tax=Phomopsis amygdali TaxID=1214568 RepID=UPI0022FE7565|nr:ubx domain-containing protein [Diaporthe amygdali]KAJ0121573.1 ubx domain-containing protein [Diaporthe amygdali]
MSSHVVVVSPDVKRVSVKVNPGTYMFDVLEEACKKLNLEVDKWSLKHQKNVINLSDQFRITRLTPGAKLELVASSKTTSVVNVALKLPEAEAKTVPNGRLMEKFRSDTTLWKMLRSFESKGSPSGHTLNFTDRGIPQTSNGTQAGSGQLYYEMPSLRIMSREISTLADFQKTLAQLGLTSGSHMIQLSFKSTDKTLNDAMQEISQFFKEEKKAEAKEKGAVAGATPVQTQSLLDAPNPESVGSSSLQAPLVAETGAAAPDGSRGVEPAQSRTSPGNALSVDGQSDEVVSQSVDAMEVDDGNTQPRSTDDGDPVPGSNTSNLQPVNIFSAPTNTTPAAASVHVPDSVYTPTIAHAQAHQQKLQASAINKRLKSDAELAAEAQAEEAKAAAVKKIDVKVRFPDETSAQWSFGPKDTGATVYKAVREVMANDSAPFKLVLPGVPSPSNLIKDDDGVKHTLVRGYKLSGRVLVNLVWENEVSQNVKKAPFLKDSYASQAKKVEPAKAPQEEEEDESSAPAPVAPPPQSQSNDSGSSRKMPKWLKGLSKK